MLLEQIQQTNDIKKINPKDYPLLAEEIRQFLIEKISVTGGHLGSNLGAVELTMAMHIALNLPEDKIVWDVGHQSYTHKLLTGRREGFDHLRNAKRATATALIRDIPPLRFLPDWDLCAQEIFRAKPIPLFP